MATPTGLPDGFVHSTCASDAPTTHGSTTTAAAIARMRLLPRASATSAPALTSSSALMPYTPMIGAKPASHVSVCEYPSDNHMKPDRNQPRHHSMKSHAAGMATSQRNAPEAGNHRATM